MKEKHAHCLNCSADYVPVRHRGARWLAFGTGAIIGGAATGSLLGGAVVGTLAYGLASAVDEFMAHRCPKCHVVIFEARRRRVEPEAASEITPEMAAAARH